MTRLYFRIALRLQKLLLLSTSIALSLSFQNRILSFFFKVLLLPPFRLPYIARCIIPTVLYFTMELLLDFAIGLLLVFQNEILLSHETASLLQKTAGPYTVK